jgi:hypothetical protein
VDSALELEVWDAFIERLAVVSFVGAVAHVARRFGDEAEDHVLEDVRAVLLGFPRARMLTNGFPSRSGTRGR